MGQIFQMIFERENAKTMEEMENVIYSALASTMQAMRCATSTSLNGVAPGALVFGHDMWFSIPIVTDIILLTENW